MGTSRQAIAIQVRCRSSIPHHRIQQQSLEHHHQKKIHARAEGKADGKTEQRRVEARIVPMRREFAGCLAAGAEDGEMKARRWSLLQKRMASCRGCRMGVGVEGRLASLGDECRLRCGGGGDREIACSIEDVEVGLARQVVEEEAAVAAAGNSVLCSTKESRLDQRCQWIHIGEEIPGGAQELRCGKSLGVPQSVMRVDANRRTAFGLATPAYLALGPCYQGRNFACCTASPGHRLVLSDLPYGGRCPVAWRIHRDVQDCPGPVQV